MKALLIKDFYTITRQLKIFLIIILLFACMPGYTMSNFAVFYIAMLPVTALAYDERSKWNTLAKTMPYSLNDIVVSKYVLGYIGIILAGVVSIVAQSVISIFKSTVFGSEAVVSVAIIMCLSTMVLSVTLPFMFKFGVEKGRLVFIGVLAFVGGAIMIFADLIDTFPTIKFIKMWAFGAVLLAVTIIINCISIFVAKKICKN